MSDHWDFYFSNVNDALASLFVDLGIRKDPGRPWLLWVWVHFNQPRDDGLSSSAEAPVLHEIEDALTNRAAAAQLVGRITTQGRRELYFYAPEAKDLEAAAADIGKQFPQYRFETGTEHDPEWRLYRDVLYPTPRDWQRIKNRHVIEVLEERGDSLAQARPVSHWIYFKTPWQREQYRALVEAREFVVTSESQANDKEFPFGLVVERVDRVDWDSINAVTLELFALADEHDADYDGWETQVIAAKIVDALALSHPETFQFRGGRRLCARG